MNFTINALYIGKPQQFKKPGLKSSINRQEVSEIKISNKLLIGDEVSNKKYHGGANRVLHFYPIEHYQYFQEIYSGTLFIPGSIGENISTKGLNELNVNIGDIYQVGNIKCQITEPRFPCGIIDLQFEIKSLHKEALFARKLGWFSNVLEDGTITTKDKITLLDRPYPKLSLDRVINALNEDNQEKVLEEMIKNPILSASWKNKALKKIELS
ncbi:MOSC domain-containing protein [Halobacteriovorax sp. HLS]|uniref:MOSC domain-containing protein n=1 Tax=Halobacteriovorax sp. HLS TaxID=2234000 RepID=UPI000FDAE30E|nr:MOSC domain-containing protein [Halobacteriovorax sp. HLS]